MKLPTLISFFLLKISLSLLDKLRKCCHKFTHVLQLSQSCLVEDSNSSNKFRHLIASNIWTTLITLSTQSCSAVLVFSLVGWKVFFSTCFKKIFVRLHIYNVSSVSLSWFSYFLTFLISFYSLYTFLYESLALVS